MRPPSRRELIAAQLADLKMPGTLEALDEVLAGFDFGFQPSIKREQIDALHELGFLERRENVVFLGPLGVGKTHLAISLPITAAENGRKIYFGTLTALVDSLEVQVQHAAARGDNEMVLSQ